ncbi:MAG: (Fe-S)-binding protein [Bacteroidia bacterium]|nr:(Fe-S)-binding protein [Bacteroidia bacterium]
MIKQIVFITATIISFGILGYSLLRIYSFLKLTKNHKKGPLGKRLYKTITVAIFQTKILRRPVIGLLHALVFWGFIVILFGSVEIIIDGFTGIEKSLSSFDFIYQIISISGDVFSWIILIAVCVFFVRRVFLTVTRFEGIEMKRRSHSDANFALSLIFVLMVTLIWMNILYSAMNLEESRTLYPINALFGQFFTSLDHTILLRAYEINWWTHIGVIFLFMNILPYSKHFHVFMSIPNVFFSRIEPLGKLPNMDNITKEVKLMMDPNLAFAAPTEPVSEIERFGVKDVEDVTWKNYLDSLACTQCGRCTASCPANITGKMLSPRKIMIDLRKRMNEKAPHILKEGKNYNDNKSLLRDYITTEELWACTTCNSCAQECPVNINHPEMIVFMRRFLVMEESAAPTGLNVMFTNIENNGAPWPFSPEDRLLWANDLTTN